MKGGLQISYIPALYDYCLREGLCIHSRVRDIICDRRIVYIFSKRRFVQNLLVLDFKKAVIV